MVARVVRVQVHEREPPRSGLARDPLGVGLARVARVARRPRLVQQVPDAAGELGRAGVVARVGDQRQRVLDAQAGGRVPVARLGARGDGEGAERLLAGAQLADRRPDRRRRDRRAQQRREQLGAGRPVQPGAGRVDRRQHRQPGEIGEPADVVEVEVREREVDALHAVQPLGLRDQPVQAGAGVEDERGVAAADEHARRRAAAALHPAAAAQQPGAQSRQRRTASEGSMPGRSFGSSISGPACRVSGITPAQTSIA